MKLRTSYVSNSSSSSFLILYRDLKDFDQLKAIKGYETFMKDLQDPKSKELCIAEIERFILDVVFEVEDNCPVFREPYPFESYDTVETLMETAKVPVEKLDKLLHKYRELAKEYMGELLRAGLLNKIERCSLASMEREEHNKYCELRAKFIKTCTNLRWSDKEIKILADEIYKGLQEQGFEAHRLEYEDRTDEGWYMEKGFMPFIAKNPDCQYGIFINNNH